MSPIRIRSAGGAEYDCRVGVPAGGRMYGLKNVRNRQHDALSRIDPGDFESLLATYYRGQGYEVEHCGTGGTRSRFDGGIDLKLRKDDQYILVQCKRWNAKQVPHNDVHQLLGIMVNEGATGAILITSGEFTKAAIHAATRQGHVQLIDGDELRAMIGAVPEPQEPSYELRSAAASLAGHVGERLLLAAEDRIAGRDSARRLGRRIAKTAASLFWVKVLLPLVFAGLIALVAFVFIRHTILGVQPVSTTRPQPKPVPTPVANSEQPIVKMPHYSGPGGAVVTSPRPLSAAERRELKRRDEEAMKALKESTPEM